MSQVVTYEQIEKLAAKTVSQSGLAGEPARILTEQLTKQIAGELGVEKPAPAATPVAGSGLQTLEAMALEFAAKVMETAGRKLSPGEPVIVAVVR